MHRLGVERCNLMSGPIFVIAIRVYNLRHTVFRKDSYARMVNLSQGTNTISLFKTLDHSQIYR